MKKRIITMALAVIMLLAVLTGCGDNASNPGNDTPTTQVVKLSVGTRRRRRLRLYHRFRLGQCNEQCSGWPL